MLKMGKYRHFKGGEYQVLGVALHSETQEPYVVYRALYGEGGLWIRPLSSRATAKPSHALPMWGRWKRHEKNPAPPGFFLVYSTLFSDSTISTLRSFRLITTLTMRVNARVSTAAKR